MIARAQQGDTAAFEQLVDAHAPYVYNLALRTLQNERDAEDVTQESFVRVWRGLSRFRADAHFRTWLYRIVVNLCYNRLPKLKRELRAVEVEDVVLVDDTLGVERAVVSAEIATQLNTAIANLPDTQRLVITLRHQQGLSYDEIATITELPLGTIKTHIFRARKALKVALLPYLA